MKERLKQIKQSKPQRVDERVKNIKDLRGIELHPFEKRKNEKKIQGFFRSLRKNDV